MTVTGWLSPLPAFPRRTLIVAPSAASALTAASVRVSENGAAAGPLTITPAVDAAPGSVGIVVVLDRNASLGAAGLAAEMAAARRFASLRRSNQLLGVTAFDSAPSTILGLTAGAGQISRSLAVTPPLGSGADPAAAVAAALAQLRAARVTLGAVVVISDGVGVARGSLSPAGAASLRIPVITIGLRDAAATRSSLLALQRAAPGSFMTASPAQLARLVDGVQQALDRDYLVSWRSSVARGRSVSVTATVNGMTGTVTASYAAPRAIAAPGPSGAAAAAQARAANRSSAPGPSAATAVPGPAGATPLSPTPGFGTAAGGPRAAVPAQASAVGRSPSSAPAPPGSPAQATAVPAATGFWASSLAAPLIAGLVGVLIAIAVALALRRPQRRTVRSRIGSFTPLAEEQSEAGLRAPEHTRGGPLRALQRGSWWPPFVEAVEISRNRHTPTQLVARAAIVGVVAGVLLGVGTGIPALGLIPVLAWPFVLRSMVNRAVAKQRAKFADGLPTYLQDLASAIRVGRSFVGALSAVAESADEPTRGELERAITNEALGRPLEECLDAVAHRMASVDMDQVALIAGLNRRSGSNVAESLDRVAEGARERADMRREMKALTAQAKMSSLVLTAMPGVLLVGLSVISPQYAHPLFHTTLGIVAVVMGALMCAGGWKVMKKITDVDAV